MYAIRSKFTSSISRYEKEGDQPSSPLLQMPRARQVGFFNKIIIGQRLTGIMT